MLLMQEYIKTKGKKSTNKPEAHIKQEPHSRVELKIAADARRSEIDKEFRDGFQFLNEFPQSVTFFGSARFGHNNPHYKQARRIAERVVKELDYARSEEHT